MSDPSSGVAHPIFFPAGRLDPVVTLTRCIDMYLIGPFPRPQFFGGPRPQLLAVPRPQFSLRDASPPRTGPRTPAERCAEPTHRATRHHSRQSIGTTRAPPSTPGSTRRRAARHGEAERPTGRPAAQRPEPTRRPGRSRTTRSRPPRRPRATRADASHPHDAPNGETIKSATQTQTLGHSRRAPNPGTTSTGRPSGRAAERRRRAREQHLARNRRTEPETRIETTPHATTKSLSNGHRRSRRRRSRPSNGIQRPHFNDPASTTGKRAEHARRTASDGDIQQDIRPAQRQSESSTSPPHDRECGAPERPRSSTIGTRRPNEKAPSRSRPERDEIHP